MQDPCQWVGRPACSNGRLWGLCPPQCGVLPQCERWRFEDFGQRRSPPYSGGHSPTASFATTHHSVLARSGIQVRSRCAPSVPYRVSPRSVYERTGTPPVFSLPQGRPLGGACPRAAALLGGGSRDVPRSDRLGVEPAGRSHIFLLALELHRPCAPHLLRDRSRADGRPSAHERLRELGRALPRLRRAPACDRDRIRDRVRSARLSLASAGCHPARAWCCSSHRVGARATRPEPPLGLGLRLFRRLTHRLG